MKLLDLFCCAGGASEGYRRAGFEVVGVDINPQPHYPFEFIQADALTLSPAFLAQFDAFHASPPCQAYTLAQRLRGNSHPDLIPATRALLWSTKRPWIMENVERSPLRNTVMLCGAMFGGLKVYRHRLFESNIALTVPAHPPHTAPLRKMGRPPLEGDFLHVVGNFSGVAYAKKAMGIDWMTRDGLREAIPPAYTEYLGRQLMRALEFV
jgi:DNA (cytosine-5)-methyltransferase 1